MSLDELIARLEAASEGSRELDALIHAAVVNPPVMVDGGSWKGDVPAAYEPMSMVIGRLPGKDLAELTGCPRYTTSLDAAMGLVPEGWYWRGGNGDGFPARPHVWMQVFRGNYNEHDGRGATVALALCIASLRARVQP